MIIGACDTSEEPGTILDVKVSGFTLYDAESGTLKSVYEVFYEDDDDVRFFEQDSHGNISNYEWNFADGKLISFLEKFGSSCTDSSIYQYKDSNHLLVTRKDCDTYNDSRSIYLNDENLSYQEYWYKITSSSNDTLMAQEFRYEDGDIVEVYDLLNDEIDQQREYTNTLIPENFKFVYSRFNLLNAGLYRNPRHMISKYVSYSDHTIYYKIEYEFDIKGNVENFTTYLSDFTEDNYQPWYRVVFEYEPID